MDKILGILGNGRVRALLGALTIALVAHFGFEGPVADALLFIATFIGGAAIPSETLGTKK